MGHFRGEIQFVQAHPSHHLSHRFGVASRPGGRLQEQNPLACQGQVPRKDVSISAVASPSAEHNDGAVSRIRFEHFESNLSRCASRIFHQHHPGQAQIFDRSPVDFPQLCDGVRTDRGPFHVDAESETAAGASTGRREESPKQSLLAAYQSRSKASGMGSKRSAPGSTNSNSSS